MFRFWEWAQVLPLRLPPPPPVRTSIVAVASKTLNLVVIHGSESRTFFNSEPGLFSQTVTRTITDDVKYLGSARARLGFLPVKNVLLYGTAGLAWERVEQSEGNVNNFAQPVFTQITTSRVTT